MTRQSLALLLAAAPLAAQPPVDIMKRDQALSRAVQHNGLTRALATALTDDAVVLYAGAPVVRGRSQVMTLLRAQPLLDSLTISWAPADSWRSAKDDFAITSGVGTVTQNPQQPSRAMTYIAAWRADGGTWRVAGLVLGGIGAAARTAIPEGLGPRQLPAIAAAGVASGMIQADIEFSALAGRSGAAEAFRHFAAPDAVTRSPAGPRRGPDQIAAAVGAGDPADWSWFPVIAFASAAGDLGVTVGQSTIKARDGTSTSNGKYLTAWQRQADGTFRYVTDAGNGRPAP